MKGKIALVIFSLLILISCRNGSKVTDEFSFPEADTIPLSDLEELSPEFIADISKNITSPVEIANLLQMLDIPYSQEYLASSIDAKKQSTNFDKAVKLGILGADLGYLNMYEKTGSSLDLLSSIRQLAEDLRVGQYFDFELIKRLSQNKSNLDSLLFISTDSYSQIDNYLRSNDRGQLSALMIIGVWIEGQYLATQVMNRYPDQRLSDRIGEQKIILNDLILLVKPYCNRDPEYRKLCSDLNDIREAYRDVQISYSQGEPVSVEKNGKLEIIQTETSEVHMSPEQLTGITDITKDIRNRLIINN
ncbi:MAG TPA: hypothetical protein VK155_03140 [Bacteroidales bacterium]|jgi:hypothetical protein|nr:hypothetical protein [Bacteroidales bacterium]